MLATDFYLWYQYWQQCFFSICSFFLRFCFRFQSASAKNGRYPEITLFPSDRFLPQVYSVSLRFRIEKMISTETSEPRTFSQQHCTAINQSVKMIFFSILYVFECKECIYGMMVLESWRHFDVFRVQFWKVGGGGERANVGGAICVNEQDLLQNIGRNMCWLEGYFTEPNLTSNIYQQWDNNIS